MKRAITLLLPMAAWAASSLAAHPTVAFAGYAGDHLSGQIVDVRVRVDGEQTPLYVRPWSWDTRRRYFEAIQGGHYSVELRNLTDRRIGVLMSVDGLNVVSGLRSSLEPGEGMYVLGPFQTAEIRGWRTSLDEVRQFVFVDEARSYASRTGQANGDMGWIRVAAFEELRPVALGFTMPRDRAERRATDGTPEPREPAKDHAPADEEGVRREGSAAPRAQGYAQDELSRGRDDSSFPGTGWGERSEDHVIRTEFRAERVATDQLVLRYEYASGLGQLGIYTRERRIWDREDGALGFAQAPRR